MAIGAQTGLAPNSESVQRTSVDSTGGSEKQPLLERSFESFLWNSRLLVLVPVIVSLAMGAGMLVIATTDAIHLLGSVIVYPVKSYHSSRLDTAHADQREQRATTRGFADSASQDQSAKNFFDNTIAGNAPPPEPDLLNDKDDLRTQTVAHIVEVIDGYLLATIMLIFAFGLYELFISRLDVAGKNKLASRLLTIRSLDDLKDRLAKVVLLILVVKFFEHAVRLPFNSATALVQLSIGIILIAGALYLNHRRSEHGTEP